MISRNRNILKTPNGLNVLRTGALGLCALVVTGVQQVAAQESQSTESRIQKLDSYFERCEGYKICNGTVLVTDGGQLVYTKTMGQAGVDAGVKLEANHQFDIGSITKQFTATAIMRLKDQGKLAFDDDVRKYLPELAYEGITIRHLLNHTSGVPEVMGYYSQQYRQGKVKENITNDGLLKVLAEFKMPVRFGPQEKWAYSNTGYTLLASIVERVSEKSFSIFLDDEFFNPLGMKDTVLRTPDTEDEIDKRAYGFSTQLTGEIRKNDQIPFFYLVGGGGIYATISDLHKWEQALSAGQLVSAESWKEATTPITLADGSTKEYGFGWGLRASKLGAERVAHGGHWRGFKAAFEMFPNKDRSIIMLTNNGADDSVDQAVDDVEAILEGKEPAPLKRSIAQALYKVVSEGGADAAQQFVKQTASKYYFDEDELNRLGYFLLGNDKIAEAIAVFEINTETFPTSANTFDSLAEAFLKAGQKAKAVATYEKVLKLDPDFEGAQEKLAELRVGK
ncbi:serine hydrolase [Kordiimonas sp. SCSIO 12603]|uniref:serine hydrolase n=1 Tax=Kordiimonas sp. SCSIO 12603 TaxID=2829596 RepID=UPI00210330DD|nr:serine hydrolase [Kordiimonas sp. SCSIO 12603]UTW60247.1 serine hydrolase [Kordiimonas sp. SCSIO 12603]